MKMRERISFLDIALRRAISPACLRPAHFLWAIFLGLSSGHAGARVTLFADVVQASGLSSKGVQVSLAGPRASVMEISLDEIMIEDRRWRDLRFSCPVVHVDGGMIQCDDGMLRIGRAASLPVSFFFSAPGSQKIKNALVTARARVKEHTMATTPAYEWCRSRHRDR